MQIASELIESVCPESIAILRLDNPAVLTAQATARSSRIAVSNPSASVATH
jgi:hypothetical protein